MEQKKKITQAGAKHVYKFVPAQDYSQPISDEYLYKKYGLSEEEIEYYVSKYKPFDKAGAYGIQEWIGYIGCTGLKGSYYNVMGLPVQRIYEELNQMSE